MTISKNKYISSIIIIAMIFAFSAINPQHTEPRLVTIITADGALAVSTTKTLVADILAEAGISLDPEYDRIDPPLTEELSSDYLVIDTAVKVRIKVDGGEREVVTWAKTVAELLREQKIDADGDLVNFPLETGLSPGLDLEIIRVDRELVKEEEAIAAKTIYKTDATLALGKKKVQTPARDGKKQITYEVIYHDGVEVSRSIIGETVLVQPVAGVIVKGTRATASRGETKAETPGGGNTIEGIASYYGAELHGNKTASGVPFDMYALTAAHKTLAFGTKVKVTYLATGKSVVVEVNDRGPFTPGRIIDLSAAAAKEIGLYADGVGKVRLEVLN
jgi:rare lipoprotein A